MRPIKKIRRLFCNILRRNGLHDTLEAELLAYVEETTERNIIRGMSREEALRQALMEAGGIEQIKEDVRDAWLGRGIETALQDVRSAYRVLVRSPGFTLLVVLTLALGIGANLTMFSLVNAVLWRPLPYPEPDRIVSIDVEARDRPNVGATPGEVFDLRERGHSFEQVSTIESVDAKLEYEGEAQYVTAASVSDDFLPLLGARPTLGRALRAQIDSGKQQAFAVLISDQLWRRRFSADSRIIGKVVRIDNSDMQIAGVLPRGFRLFLPAVVSESEEVDVWLPYAISGKRQYRGMPIVARLRSGVTLEQSNAELRTLAAQFAREHPEFYSGDNGWQASPADHGPGVKLRFRAQLLHEEMTRDARPALFLLSVAVGFVLLIACVNVANLMLGRGALRQREFDIRQALGAGRTRIIRQLLTESLLLGAAAATIGLCWSRFALGAIGNFTASQIPLQSRAQVDGSTALFALVLSLITTILFGLLPAWRMASRHAGDRLRAGRSETAGSGARRLQRTLVVAEVALSIVPLACGGLMLRSFLNLLNAPLGFNPTNVITARVPLNLAKSPEIGQQWALLRDVLDRVDALPDVQSVSAANPLPLASNQQTRRVGRTDQPGVPPILATQQGAIPGYLGVMRIPLLEGRDFTDVDVATKRDVTIIDERLAKRLWPEGAIGKHLVVYRTGWRSNLEVVGVTGSVRAKQVRDESIPHFMMPSIEMSLVIKTPATVSQITPGIKAALNAAQGGLAPFDIRPMSDYVSDSIGDSRFLLFLLTAFAVTSVLLAAVGLYGTLAYLTAQRTREFGIRLALGSSVNALIGIVIRESVLLAVTGAAVGLAGAAAATRAIRGLLYGVQPLDSMTLIGVVALLGIVALAAACVPAWRATRIDPQMCLRTE